MRFSLCRSRRGALAIRSCQAPALKRAAPADGPGRRFICVARSSGLPRPAFQRCRDMVPIDQMVEEGRDEVGPAVLVVEIISMLPHVAGEEGHLTLRQRIDRVQRLNNFELVPFADEPAPAAAELVRAGGGELRMELVEAAE